MSNEILYKIISIDGNEFACHFGLSAMATFCRDTGRKMEDLANIQSFDMIETLMLFRSGLVHGERLRGNEFKLTWEQLGDLFDNDPEAMTNFYSEYTDALLRDQKKTTAKPRKKKATGKK